MNTKLKREILFIALISAFFSLQFHELLFKLPYGIHEWAQGDRLALAYGFYDNGLNFFKPSTLSQFSKDGITGVEFPIQAYISAILAKLFGKAYISILFRLLDTLIIGFCLLQLYKIMAAFTKTFILAALPSLTLLLSPCFLNYTCSYMPDTVSVAILLIGMGYYLQVWVLHQSGKRFPGVTLCILATLIKTSCGIYLVGFVMYDLYWMWYNPGFRMLKKSLLAYLSVIALGFIIIIGYIFYNQYLNKAYNSSLFLLDVRPIKIKDAKYLLLKRIPTTWLREYFILAAYPFFAVLSIPLYVTKRFRNTRTIFLPLIILLLIGVAAFFYLMGAQFADHDYYAIPTFFPFIILHMMWFSIAIAPAFQKTKLNWAISASMLLLLCISYLRTQDRLSPNYKGFSEYYNTEWMKNGAYILDSINIPRTDTIAILNENPPNLSLIYFNRKGYVVNSNWWSEQFESANHFFAVRNLTYGICKKKEYERVNKTSTNFDQFFYIIYQNQDMIIFKRKS